MLTNPRKGQAMIKRLIFDVDNTLIEWKKEYYQKIHKPFEELNISYTQQDLENVVKTIDIYDKEYEYYKIDDMQKLFCKSLNKQLPDEFTNTVLKYFKTCIPDKLSKEDIETLEHLYEKYELVILTNWFEDVQKIRLEKLDILKYFKKIYATEKIKAKPNKESFENAIGNNKPEECIMIGDNLNSDIYGAINCGINAIYINPTALKEEKHEYKIINQLSELKDIL